jgi:predicted RNA-binding protein with PIN domain
LAGLANLPLSPSGPVKYLIDGYNLLQATGLFGPSAGHNSLEGSRRALLDFLLEALSPVEQRRTIVVFDAAAAPPGAPALVMHEEITVRFSRRHGTADDLLEEMIDAEPDPRHVTVVSGDHRVQRAARRRRAQFVDSDVWYHELVRKLRSSPGSDASSVADKPSTPGLENPFPPGYVEQIERELGEK